MFPKKNRDRLAEVDAKPWYVYVIETEKRTLYAGIAKDVQQRFELHKRGKGAKFFRISSPTKIVYTEACDSKETALKREIEIKNLSTKQKRELIFERSR